MQQLMTRLKLARVRDVYETWLERAAQEAEFAEKAHRNKIEELKRSIATAQEQSARLFASMQQGSLELEDDLMDRLWGRPHRRVPRLSGRHAAAMAGRPRGKLH